MRYSTDAGKSLASSAIVARTCDETANALGARRLHDAHADRRLVVEQRAQAVFGGGELDAGDVGEPRDAAVGRGF